MAESKSVDSRSDILWTSGPVPVWIRLITLPFLAGVLWVVGIGIVDRVASIGDRSMDVSIGGLIASGVLAVFLAGLWFWNNWVYLDPPGEALVLEHRGLLGSRRRIIRIAEMRAISLHAGSIRASHFWDVSIVTANGGKIWFTRIYGEDDAPPRDRFVRLVDATKCAVIVE